MTGRCNARCDGCINSAVTWAGGDIDENRKTWDEADPVRDSEIVIQLAARHPNETITLCFYGGEPFLAQDLMVKTWKRLQQHPNGKRIRFLVYTNGELLIEAWKKHPDFMSNMWLYSVSIDGDIEQHNRIRKGTDLQIIRSNLLYMRERYKGHVLFWSTLREGQSLHRCFDEFMRMYEGGIVSQFFWHWAESKEPIEDFKEFAGSYRNDLERILEIFVKELAKGHLLPILHLNELILYLLTGKERGHTSCGVEIDKNYDIVGGKIFPCADLPADYVIGELDPSNLLQTKKINLQMLTHYKKELNCSTCEVHFYCGGRCPVQALAGSMERTVQYCRMMRLHVDTVRDRIQDIKRILRNTGMTLQEIYDTSACLAPYTDVVP